MGENEKGKGEVEGEGKGEEVVEGEGKGEEVVEGESKGEEEEGRGRRERVGGNGEDCCLST